MGSGGKAPFDSFLGVDKLMRRVMVIVLDSVGVGELPDADLYGDRGADTLGNLARAVGGLSLPNMASMGLGRVHEVQGVSKDAFRGPGAWGKSGFVSPGKDTITGHWEMMGIQLDRPFPTYPRGFPAEVMEAFQKATGRKGLGNKVASGTEIIQELGDLHMVTGDPIVYTSADSVFQIAAHEEVIPPEALYEICEAARRILVAPHRVGRVIARPFAGTSGRFVRTDRRRDFPAKPPEATVLDCLERSLVPVTAIGKIGDIFAMRGISRSIPTHGNRDAIPHLLLFLQKGEGLCLANLIDFDMLYGHRNDVQGYSKALLQFDEALGHLLSYLRQEDYLVITADHGCDPTFPGTDHTREYVPLLVRGGRNEVSLGVRETLADLGAFVAEALGVEGSPKGRSFLEDLEGKGDE